MRNSEANRARTCSDTVWRDRGFGDRVGPESDSTNEEHKVLPVRANDSTSGRVIRLTALPAVGAMVVAHMTSLK
jgi:hypothetical protein